MSSSLLLFQTNIVPGLSLPDNSVFLGVPCWGAAFLSKQSWSFVVGSMAGSAQTLLMPSSFKLDEVNCLFVVEWDVTLPLSQCHILIWWWTDFQFLQINFLSRAVESWEGKGAIWKSLIWSNNAFSCSLSILSAGIGTMVWEHWDSNLGRSRSLNRDFWTDRIKFQAKGSGKQYFGGSCVLSRLQTLKVA